MLEQEVDNICLIEYPYYENIVQKMVDNAVKISERSTQRVNSGEISYESP